MCAHPQAVLDGASAFGARTHVESPCAPETSRGLAVPGGTTAARRRQCRDTAGHEAQACGCERERYPQPRREA